VHFRAYSRASLPSSHFATESKWYGESCMNDYDVQSNGSLLHGMWKLMGGIWLAMAGKMIFQFLPGHWSQTERVSRQKCGKCVTVYNHKNYVFKDALLWLTAQTQYRIYKHFDQTIVKEISTLSEVWDFTTEMTPSPTRFPYDKQKIKHEYIQSLLTYLGSYLVRLIQIAVYPWPCSLLTGLICKIRDFR